MKQNMAAFIFALALPAFSYADNKYGFVDVQKVLDTVEEGKQAKTDFKKKIDNKKADLDKKQAELKKLDESFEKQKMILSTSAVEEKKKELQGKMMELQKYQME